MPTALKKKKRAQFSESCKTLQEKAEEFPRDESGKFIVVFQ